MISLLCNESLCMGIKAEGPISFKSVKSVNDSHQFKTIHRLYNKKLSIVPHLFLPLLFSYGTSLVQIISRKETNIAMSVIKPVIEFFTFRKSD